MENKKIILKNPESQIKNKKNIRSPAITKSQSKLLSTKSQPKQITVKLEVNAMQAKPQPPLGPILGQNQINMIEFCKEFNEKSKIYENNITLPVNIIKNNANITINIKEPTLYYILDQFLNKSSTQQDTILYFSDFSLSILDLYCIVKKKKKDFYCDMKKSSKIIFGFLNSFEKFKISINKL